MLHTQQTLFLFAIKEGAAFAPVAGLGAGVSSVQGLLSDPSVSGRAATALLLSLDKSPEVLQALQEALTNSDWSVRAAAVHAIALRNDRSLVGSLVPLLAAGFPRLEGNPNQASQSGAESAPAEVTPKDPIGNHPVAATRSWC